MINNLNCIIILYTSVCHHRSAIIQKFPAAVHHSEFFYRALSCIRRRRRSIRTVAWYRCPYQALSSSTFHAVYGHALMNVLLANVLLASGRSWTVRRRAQRQDSGDHASGLVPELYLLSRVLSSTEAEGGHPISNFHFPNLELQVGVVARLRAYTRGRMLHCCGQHGSCLFVGKPQPTAKRHIRRIRISASV